MGNFGKLPFHEDICSSLMSLRGCYISADDPVTTAGEVVTTASVEIPEELTLAQTLIEIKTELEEEERLSRQKEEEANIALIESWDNTQAMMDADFQLAQQMQTEEQEQLSIEEKSKLFVELLEKRKKHFAVLRAQEKRNRPLTKAQKRNTMSTYLKNMAGYKHNQLKRKKLVKGSKTKAEGSSKRSGEELESDNSKKQRTDEHVEAKGDDDQEDAEMKKHMEIVQDDELMEVQKVSAAYTKVDAAGMKVTTTERLQLLEEFLQSEG
ncbi:hypothetical protein Tco_0246148 [Tanacetum coccineum]